MRLFYFSLFWLLLNLTVRETKVRGEQYPRLLVELLDDPWRIVWLGAGWLILFGLFLKRRKVLWTEFLLWIQSPGGRLMITAGVFFISSYPFDRGWFGIPHNTNIFFEEVPDSVASLLILFSSIETFSWIKE